MRTCHQFSLQGHKTERGKICTVSIMYNTDPQKQT